MHPMFTTTYNLSLLFLLFFSPILPSCSTSSTRRILHQPIYSSDTLPPPPPPLPPPPPIPDYPFTTSTPPPTTFFPNDPSTSPSPPLPPSSLTSFPANISSLNLPHSPKPKPVSTKLIATAVVSVLAALIVFLIVVFLHVKKRRTISTFSDTKTSRSDTSTRYNYNYNNASFRNNPTLVPKLTRPSQNSSEFLYLGTLVNAHVVLDQNRKMDSPELHPLPPLNIQQRNNGAQGSDEFYSPRGSIGVGSGSRRAFASLDVANLNPLSSSSSSSSSCSTSVSASPTPSASSSISPSISVSPKRPVSRPKSPQLEAVELYAPPVAPLASLSPPSRSPASTLSSSSADRLKRGLDMLSPRISSASDHNDVESLEKMCNSVQKNVLVFNPFFRLERTSNHVETNEHSDFDLGISYLCHQNGDSSGTMSGPFKDDDDDHVPESNYQTSDVCDKNVDSLSRITGDEVKENGYFPGQYSPRSSDASDQSVISPLKDNADSYELYSRVSDQDDRSPERVTSAASQVSDVSEPYSPSSNISDHHSVESPMREQNFVLLTSVQVPPPSSIPQPPPPPPLPRKSWDSPKNPTPPPRKPISEPPSLVTPLRPMVIESPLLISPIQLPTQSDYHESNEASAGRSANLHEADERSEETAKPKLKPLHWVKVRASSDREMVWDQLRSSSFKLNEEMIESLFIVKDPNPASAETTRRQILPLPSQEDRVLDPKKSQNIAILLKALHVTVDEVCDALLEGNTETLGTDLLESLLKMAPTKEEERKLKEHKDDSPVKLGPAERFLKEVLDIPFAFKRVDAMLYILNFDSEVEYLKKSFETLENACEELRSSRMFLKLLEAVLKTGNRMNVGTNRGDAHAFKLDTLHKLVDVKGADGKTTLLHFVVQEISRSEGSRISISNQYDDVKCRKLGLQVVSSLASDLISVKKAAAMDSEILNSDVIKLSKGLEKIAEVIKFNETIGPDQSSRNKFSETMNGFMQIAEEEIIRIQAQESVALTLVKEITEYFHGNSAKEEAHPFRIFMVVRDFLSVVERVCKEVGMINERTIVSSAHKFPVPVNPMLQPVSSGFPGRRQYSSSDDESPTS